MSPKHLSKKSQGISLTTVVIAALALIVLIVLILIFSGRMGLFQAGVNECPPGEQAVPNPNQCSGLPTRVIGDGDAVEYCCPTDQVSSGN